MSKDLIVVKQLPIIEEQLKGLSLEIDVAIMNALALEVTEDSVKEVKKIRADLNKQFKDLESKRKAVKNEVLAPYLAFEEIYKKYVTDKFTEADKELACKIKLIEDERLKIKTDEVFNYYIEYADELNLKWLLNDKYLYVFENNIKITLSASVKSLKESVKELLDSIVNSLNVISCEEHKDEILEEYLKSLNLANAILIINKRYQNIAEIKEQQEEYSQKIEQDKAKEEEILKAIEEPKVIDNTIYTMTFKVSGTKEELKVVKLFLEERGIKYE